MNAFRWCATMAGVFGAFVLSVNLMPFSACAFILFFFANVYWFGHGLKHGDRAMVTLQSAYIVSDLIAFWRWLL